MTITFTEALKRILELEAENSRLLAILAQSDTEKVRTLTAENRRMRAKIRELKDQPHPAEP